MKTISIINLKGGVGKTVTAVNMAVILAKDYKQNVLVIDADPQANTTQFFGAVDAPCGTLREVLRGSVVDTGDCTHSTGPKYGMIDLVPADISLIEADIASVRTGGTLSRLYDFCEAANDDGYYDYVIIDCPPSFTAASVASIYASDEIIIPVAVDSFALAGMAELVAQINSVRSLRKGIKLAGVLITMWRDTPAVTQGETILRKSALPVYDTVIRRSERIVESTFKREAIIDYSPRSSAARAYRRFVSEYLGGEA